MKGNPAFHVSYSRCLVRAGCSGMIIPRALLVCALLFTPMTFSADISGIWKHEKNPAWIEIRLEEGSGTVVRRPAAPPRAGRGRWQDSA
jgi:hypothetical protein